MGAFHVYTIAMRSSNPALNDKSFSDFPPEARTDGAMTLEGTVNKTGVLLSLCGASAVWSWRKMMEDPAAAAPWIWPALIGGFIVGLVTIFKKPWAPVTAPVYAVLEGLLLGVISAAYERRFGGIVFQAVVLTFGTLFALLAAYRSGAIQATDNFRLGVVSATGAIAVLYLVDLGLAFFAGIRVPFIHESGPMGILFSLFVVGLAALNLVLDFDFIEKGAASGAPKYMEWYGAFGLLVTLVWLYLEILRLLSKTRKK